MDMNPLDEVKGGCKVNITKFRMGQPVVSKVSGLPGVGYICGLVDGGCHRANIIQSGLGFSLEYWDRRFPDWEKDCIWFVWYNEFRKTCSLDDLKYQFPNDNEFELLEKYERILVRQMIAYTAQDLEVFE